MNKVYGLISIISALAAQEIRIAEIVDANLFLTNDSVFVSMADMEVPSIHDTDSARVELAENIVSFAKKEFKGYSIRFEKSAEKCNEGKIAKGHFFKIYPLSEVNINTKYLEYGYGAYLPCDTLHLTEYSKSAKKAMEDSKGVWRLGKKTGPRNPFNRLRLSLWLTEYHLRNRTLFPPVMGINYRWSDIFSFIKYNGMNLSLTGEMGTYAYFYFPYAAMGTEMRYKNIYIRGHYNYLLPYLLIRNNAIYSYNFWGYDLGFYIPVSKGGSVIELEFNSRFKDKFLIHLISINFTGY